MSKHTAGPWFIGAGDQTRVLKQFTAGRIQNETIAAVKRSWMTEDEAKANARLIAAAPELLEACKTFAEWLRREEVGFVTAGNSRDTPEGEAAWKDWYSGNLALCNLAQEQARAAIAKATGEQQ
jgi:hypothetical protein